MNTTRKVRMYFHVIEDCGYNRIGYQGYYTTEAEAQAQVERLSDFFPNSFFYVFASASKKEPPIVTI
jgi:hypothetical protein